jgi:cytidylate kinase
MILLVGGVAGCGKTTVGAIVAEKLRWPVCDADSFHPPENIAKMAAGIPLNDADRARPSSSATATNCSAGGPTPGWPSSRSAGSWRTSGWPPGTAISSPRS